MINKPLKIPKIRKLELFVTEPQPFYNWNWPKFPEKVEALIKEGRNGNSR